MATEKVHSVEHIPNDVARYGDYVNMNCNTPETGLKKWVKNQGVKTNQGPEVQFTMVMHSLYKECSALLCEAVQGKDAKIQLILRIHRMYILFRMYTNHIMQLE